MKKIVQRTCISCNEKKDKRELLRVVLNKNGEIFVDTTGKAEGRGLYICKNEDCLNKAKKAKKLEKKLEINISDDIYESIRGVILKNEEKNKLESKNVKFGGDING